jgi:hypothetical protein
MTNLLRNCLIFLRISERKHMQFQRGEHFLLNDKKIFLSKRIKWIDILCHKIYWNLLMIDINNHFR